jgi:hypothetical protein
MLGTDSADEVNYLNGKKISEEIKIKRSSSFSKKHCLVMIHIHITDMPSAASETAFSPLTGNLNVDEVMI